MYYCKLLKLLILIFFLLIYNISANCITRLDSLQQITDTISKQIPDTIKQSTVAVKADSVIKIVVPDTVKILVPDTVKKTEKIDSITPQAQPKDTLITNKPVVESKPANITVPLLVPSAIATDTMRLDTIIKKSGGRMKVQIEGKNLFEILFKMPGQKITKKMSTSSIREIRYANGKIEIIDNSPEKRPKDWVPVVSEIEYSKIIIAKDEAAVSGLVEKGEVDANYVARKMMADNSFLEKNALIILRKKAVSLKATTILVTMKDITREYGEYPSIIMKATVFGSEKNEE